MDQLLMGVMTFVSSLMGLPWMCASALMSIAHISSLSVMSSTHAPGEKPKLVEVKEQRVTNVLLNVMIGKSLQELPPSTLSYPVFRMHWWCCMALWVKCWDICGNTCVGDCRFGIFVLCRYFSRNMAVLILRVPMTSNDV